MGALFRHRFGIRFKLVLMSAFLLVVPWLGYLYILEMEEYLRRGQEQVVLGTAQALATALSERPELFSDSSYSRGEGLGEGSRDLYVYPIFTPLAIDDGNLNDWRDYQLYEREYSEQGLGFNVLNQFSTVRNRTDDDALSYRLMLGEHNRNLYVYLKVRDRSIVWRDRDGLRVDRSDSIRLALLSRDGIFERYVISPYQDEYIYPYRIGSDITDISSLQHEPRITGRWNQTRQGYEVEFRMPLEMLGERMAIAVFDVDDPVSRDVAAIVASSGINSASQLGNLRRPTPEIDRIVAGMGHTNSRIQVVDAEQRMLLSVGDLQTATGLMLQQQEEEAGGPLAWIQRRILRPVYYRLLSRPTEEFIDDLYSGGVVEGEHISSALSGAPMTRFRTLERTLEDTHQRTLEDTHQRALDRILVDTHQEPEEDEPSSGESIRILEAAYPILANDEVLGAVIVDQNMNGIRTFRNQALETLFNTMLAMLLVTMAALFVFASSLSSRIRGLRNQAEKSIDDSGRLVNAFTPSRSGDEIGDLSRSFANLVERLGQYTNYLENMSSRLSHELRTPVTVVRSSLENLHMSIDDQQARVYIERAEEGIKRLNLILTNMSEAARLEQILLESDKELTDMGKVVSACMEGYHQIYPQQEFVTSISDDDLKFMGGADYIAQLLDKVIANAIEFSYAGKPVRVSCYREDNEVVLSISNSGPYLMDTMKDRIFDSMVSVRPQTRQAQPHLGMGLHIARMVADYHGGYIFADNLIKDEGVIVSLRVPAHNIG